MAADNASAERCDRGRCEIELCTLEHSEADLQRAFIMCSKNPGHEEFIPVYKFQRDHLPKGFQEGCLMELIQVLSHLTVRVAVQYTSEDRPQICPHNRTPYPFYLQRDTNMIRTGTGWVWNVEKFSQMYDMRTCSCPECRISDNPETKWAEIVIGSAAHVVFDDKEGKHTTCHLFYDKGSRPEVCEGVVTLQGMSRVDTNIREDKCKMIYITHDMELADRLESLTKRFVDLQKILSQVYNSTLNSIQMQSRRGVSMSRNSSRSRGVESQRRQMTSDVVQTKDLSSKKTLSRGLILEELQPQNMSPDRLPESPISERSRSRFVTKRGVNSKISTHDMSQQGAITYSLSELRRTATNRSPLRNITTNTSQSNNVSTDKVQTHNGTDVHLPKIIVTSHNSTCHSSQARNDVSQISKNFSKGQHAKTDLIPNSQLKTNLCNISQSSTDLWKLPQSISNLSNRSEQSNSSKVDCNQSQSISVSCDQSQLQNVLIQSNSRKVLLDKSPLRQPVLIRVKDKNATFQRNEPTPVPRLTPVTSNTRNDQSGSTSSRTDRNKAMNYNVNQSLSMAAISNQLESINAKVNQSRSTQTTPKVFESRNSASERNQSSHQQFYKKTTSKRSQLRHEVSHEPKLILSRRSQSTDGISDTVANPALTVIVSHPHGCNKQITIGYYTERVEVKDSRNLTRYVYTTATCPGSSGAPVYVLGRWRGWWPCDHPHSGNSEVNKNLNYSGVGLH